MRRAMGVTSLIPDGCASRAAVPVLGRHRLVLRPEAELEGGFDTDRVIADILAATALPK